jgi:hypothetical protein
MAEREDPPHGRWPGADGEVHLLRISAFGEFDDHAEAGGINEAQPAEIEHQTLWTARQHPGDRVLQRGARGEITLTL